MPVERAAEQIRRIGYPRAVECDTATGMGLVLLAIMAGAVGGVLAVLLADLVHWIRTRGR